ncbi:MAG: sigma 54-interacting transcriptional regulator, partial [Deltaproteobacteria bacterium]|nr:sigma 54-interacting transcriptional regulator [Deltaproteobacteria bacterium]
MTVDKIQFFHQATIRICGSLDIEKALWQLYRYLETLMPMSGMNLHLFESGLSTLRTIAQATRDETGRMDQTVSLSDEIRAELERGWLETEDVMIFNRPELDPFMRAMTRLFGHPERSIMVMRLKIEKNRIGALTLFAEGKDQYNKEHSNLLAMLHDPIAIAMSNAVKHQEVLKFKDMLVDDNLYLHQELLRISGDEIIGRDKGLKRVMELVRKVAPLNSPVLLLGETGVGKEVIANAIHYLSPRKSGPFIKVNCGAIPETLVDSELFGHEKGAFTGATARKRGRFERAHKGTIFLDEIGDLPLQMQVRLLRVLQNKQIERVGGTEYLEVDIRIIVATHRDLRQMVTAGQFREDLWFRLNVFPIVIPHLRERKGDIPELVRHFVERKAREMKFHEVPPVAPESIEKLKDYNWPGNVRELENVVERAMIQNRGKEQGGPLVFEPFLLKSQDRETLISSVTSSETNDDSCTLDKAVSMHIQKALKRSNGKIHGHGGAAERLGINPTTLRSRMSKLGIPFKKQKSL